MSSSVSTPSRTVPPGRLQGGLRLSASERPAQPPLVSVISVVRNALPALQKTVQSVLAQDGALVEYIVIDGVSNDGSREYLHSLGSQVHYWLSEEDRGIYDAMNKGIQAARGKWIHFLNAGDVYDSPEFWAGLAPQLLQYDKSVVFCPVATLIGAGKPLAHRGRRILYGGMPYCHQGILFRRDLFESLGLFDLNYRICSDYDWLIRYFQTPNAGLLSDYAICGQHAVIFDTGGLSSLSFRQREREVREIVRRHYGVSWQWARCSVVSHARVIAKSALGLFGRA